MSRFEVKCGSPWGWQYWGTEERLLSDPCRFSNGHLLSWDELRLLVTWALRDVQAMQTLKIKTPIEVKYNFCLPYSPTKRIYFIMHPSFIIMQCRVFSPSSTIGWKQWSIGWKSKQREATRAVVHLLGLQYPWQGYLPLVLPSIAHTFAQVV